MDTNICCPVCGAKKNALSISDYDCEHCGFNNAFIHFFASKKSHDLWLEKVNIAKNCWRNEKRRIFASSDVITMGSSIIAYNDLHHHTIYIIHGNGDVQIESNAVDIKSNERNYAIVYEDGSVKVFGDDNSFGQRNTSSWSEIQAVAMGSNCTYGVTKCGKVIHTGVPVSKQPLSWTNIIKLCCETEYIVGLHADGNISIAGDAPEAIFSTVINWHDIDDIKMSRDCILALEKSGKVLFAGNLNSPKINVTKWEGIISISADNNFVYGLTKNGNVMVAGSCKEFLDKGRSLVTNWHGIIAFSSNKSGISAIAEDGNLMFAGSISGDRDKMMINWENIIKPIISFV